MMRRILIGLLLLVAANEIAHLVAARQNAAPGGTGQCTVLVLGFPSNDDGSASDIQRQRMTAAMDAVQAFGCERMVISGGAAHNTIVEADVMATLVPASPALAVMRERRAKDTRQNIAFSLPLIPTADRLIIVSHALHVQRARGYVCAADPQRCERTFVHATAQSWWLVPQRLVETAHEVQVLASGG
jgi:uncharacterized SAM-binding protein YcdF (DUF218 family)